MHRRKFDRRPRMLDSDVSPSLLPEEESIPPRRRHEVVAGKRGSRHSYSENSQESNSKSWSSPEPTEEENEEEEDDDGGECEDEGSRIRKYRERRFTAPSSVVESSADTPFSGVSSGKNWTSQQPTYINVAPLPIFRGNPSECPVAHLSRFARVCRANNAATAGMMARIFPVTLDGEAGLWYELNVEPLQDNIPWEEMTSLFVKAFQRTEFFDQFRSELMSLRQASGESVNAFYLRIQWVLKKWPDHSIPESMIKGIFVDGLREDYQDWIIPQAPSSLEEALRLAVTWEQAQIIKARRRLFSGNESSAINTSGNTDELTRKAGKSERVLKIEGSRTSIVAGAEKVGTARCEFCDGPHDEEGCEIKKKMKYLWRKMHAEDGEKTMGGDQSAGKDAGNLPEEAMFSPFGSAGREEEKGGSVVGLERSRSSLCQCWKHRCWKRNERGSVVLDRTPRSTSKG